MEVTLTWGLVHVTGKPLELKEADTYKVSELTKRISTGSNVLIKYTDFILSSNAKRTNNLAATGAVHRGEKMFSVFLPVTPEQSVFYNSQQTIAWSNEKVTGPFVVTFNTLFDDELLKVETGENKVTIDLNSPEFENEDNVIVNVSVKGDSREPDQYTLKRLSRADRTRIENLLKELSESTAEETALNKYILAGFYEQNNLLIDAATHYLEAMRLAPDPSVYQQSYEDFLIRTGLKTPPAK